MKKRNIFFLIVLQILVSCANKPPQEPGNFKANDLVELIKLDTSIRLDIRYATTNNFAGRAVYKQARAFLQRPAAQALINVNKQLKPLGYGLMIFDGYRPWSITKLFWDITSEENKKFVADPKKGSRHNRGCAVDLTLFDLSTGKEIQMPGEYDETTERSYADYTGGTEMQRQMRDLLIRTMQGNGFTVYKYEWWHFDFNEWKSYVITNIPFTRL
ncbi:MAG: M15 family metallopeptidase [Ferruginibacter sp.]